MLSVNWGRWIVECDRPYCTNAENVEPGQTMVTCTHCKLLLHVHWPTDRDQIWDALAIRPVPSTRNWLPTESLTDLLEENKAHGLDGP